GARDPVLHDRRDGGEREGCLEARLGGEALGLGCRCTAEPDRALSVEPERRGEAAARRQLAREGDAAQAWGVERGAPGHHGAPGSGHRTGAGADRLCPIPRASRAGASLAPGSSSSRRCTERRGAKASATSGGSAAAAASNARRNGAVASRLNRTWTRS